MDEIMAIERASFAYPWSSRFFLQELEVSASRSILAEIDGKILGYVIFWLLPDAVDIHNIAVRKEYRRQGIGRLLLQHAINEGQRQSLVRVTLEVRKSNLVAQRLYRSVGFQATGLRKGYYLDDGEDAITMTLNLLP
jgi:ribosomal-protein-alanine N-acetyltransferase